MINEYQQNMSRLHVVFDILMIAAAYGLAYLLMLAGSRGPNLSASFYFSVLLVLIPVYMILNAFAGLYTVGRTMGRRKELVAIVQANTVGLLLFALVLYLGAKNVYLYNFSRRLVIYFYLLTILLELLERYGIRFVLRSIRKQGVNRREIILVGYSRAATGYIDRILRNPEWNYVISGILDNTCPSDFRYREVPVLGRIEDLNRVLEERTPNEIAITLSLADYDYLEDIVNQCERSGVHTKFIPDYNDIIPTVPQIEDVQGLPVINIRHIPLSELHNAALKRLVDIFGSAFGLLLFSPIMLVTAIAVKLSSRGPILYSQERVGKDGKLFRMYKFRSMEVQEEAEEKSGWTTKNDPRVTGVGKIIRRTSIDEMPQFWNIFKGDMSLVGPRPERPQFVEKFRDEIPHYMVKHQVRPGLTGWAQINGLRGDTSIEDRIKCDLYYIENWTLWFDFKIMFLTIFRGFVNKNAY